MSLMQVCNICSQPFEGDDDNEYAFDEEDALPFGSGGSEATCDSCKALMGQINAASKPAAPEPKKAKAPEKPKPMEEDPYAFFSMMPELSVKRKVPESKAEESKLPERKPGDRIIIRKNPGPRRTNINKPRAPVQPLTRDAIDLALDVGFKSEKPKADDDTQSKKQKTDEEFLPMKAEREQKKYPGINFDAKGRPIFTSNKPRKPDTDDKRRSTNSRDAKTRPPRTPPMKAKKVEEPGSPRYVHVTTAGGSYIDLPDSGLGSPHLKAKPMITRPEHEKFVREGAHREIGWGEKFDLDDYSGHIESGVQGGPARNESAFNFMMNIVDKQKAAKEEYKASKDEDKMDE